MTVYTEAELAYLRGERRLAHVATVGKDGTPHVTPVGMERRPTAGSWRSPATASPPPRSSATWPAARAPPSWSTTCCRPGGRGGSRSAATPRPSTAPSIRIHPTRIVAWGLDDTGGARNARDVPGSAAQGRPAARAVLGLSSWR